MYTMEYYSAIKKNTFESVLMRQMKLKPIIKSEINQREKHQYSILMHVYGIQKDGNDNPQRRRWHATSVLLPGKSHGWKSLVGCHLWGRAESDMTEVTQQQQQPIQCLLRLLKSVIVAQKQSKTIFLKSGCETSEKLGLYFIIIISTTSNSVFNKTH